MGIFASRVADEHASLSDQTTPSESAGNGVRCIGTYHAADAVVLSQSLVQHGKVRIQEIQERIDHFAVSSEECLGFATHIRYRPFVEVRIKLGIDRHAIQGTQIEPLLRESLNEAIRFDPRASVEVVWSSFDL